MGTGRNGGGGRRRRDGAGGDAAVAGRMRLTMPPSVGVGLRARWRAVVSAAFLFFVAGCGGSVAGSGRDGVDEEQVDVAGGDGHGGVDDGRTGDAADGGESDDVLGDGDQDGGDTSQGPAPLTFATYLGGASFEQARDVTIDAEGNIIVVGGTQSSDFPTTPGAYDTTFDTSAGAQLGSGGRMDVFVTKLAPDGTLVWSTFVGGPSYDRAYAVEVDAAGDIYIAGRAGAGFPTTAGALQTTFGGDNAANGLYGPQDGFIAKLSGNGTSLLWSTYFGGNDRDFIRDIDLDDTGIYVGVGELSGTHPYVTAGAYETVRSSGYDNVVAKVALTGDAVLWGTYFGGSGDDSVPSVRRGPGGTVYLVASTNATDLPTTAGALQTNKAAGIDFFVAKLAADGASLVYCTYFGGNANEDHETHHAFVTATGEVVLGFYTDSSNLPTSAGAIQASRLGPADGYVGRISADGSALVAGTYLGGNAGEDVQGIAVDAGGRIYVGGSTQSTNLMTTAGSLRTTAIGGGDAYVARLSPTLTTIEYMSYLGGSGDDQQRSLWIDRNGGLVTVGQSASPTLAVSPNAYQSTYGGGTYDVLVGTFRIPLP